MFKEAAPRKRTYQERFTTIGNAVNAIDTKSTNTFALTGKAEYHGSNYIVELFGSNHVTSPFVKKASQGKLTYVMEDASKRPISRTYSGGLKGDFLINIFNAESGTEMFLVVSGEVYLRVKGKRRISDPTFIVFSKMNADEADTISVMSAKLLADQTQDLTRPPKIYQS